MAVTTAAPEDLIESDLWNEVAYLLNGTLPSSGSTPQINAVQYSDSASYAAIVGNRDETNGYAAKFQYGPVLTPTTLLTVAKAAIDHGVLATFLTTGKAIRSNSDTPKNLDIWTARDYTRMSIIEGSRSSGGTFTPYTAFDEMVHLGRYWLPGSTSSALELSGVNLNIVIPDSAVGTSGGLNSTHNINGFTSNISSFGTTKHNAIAARFSAYSSLTNGVSSTDNIGAWGSVHQVQVRAQNHGFGIEVNTVNLATTAAAITPGDDVNTAGTFFTCGVNIFGDQSGSGAKNHVGLMIGASASGKWLHGIWFRPSAIESTGYGLDLVNVSRPIRIGNSSAIWGLTTGGSSAQAILPMDGTDRLSLRNSTAIVLQNDGATATYLQLSGAAANGQSLGIKHLTELTTIAAAATTDTAIQIPANSLVLGVTVRVTVAIPTAATFDVGVAGATTRYGTGISVNANTTNASPGTTNPTIYAAAASIRITPNLTPGTTNGRLRVTIHYLDLTAPTS